MNFSIKILNKDFSVIINQITAIHKKRKDFTWAQRIDVISISTKLKGNKLVPLLREIFNINDLEVVNWRKLKINPGMFVEIMLGIPQEKIPVLLPGINMGKLSPELKETAKKISKKFVLELVTPRRCTKATPSKLKKVIKNALKCNVTLKGNSFYFEVALSMIEVQNQLKRAFSKDVIGWHNFSLSEIEE